MEEVALAAALVLDLLALGGWMQVAYSTKAETTGKIHVCGLSVKRQLNAETAHFQGSCHIANEGGP